MALWGTSSTDESKPKWLSDGSKVGDKQDVFADARGWVLRHYKNAAQTEYWDEVVATSKGLNTALSEATITGVYFEQTSLAQAATGTVVLAYNEKVNISAGATLVVTGSVTGSVTATAAAQSDTNKITFDFTVPSTAETLSIGAQTITATIVDQGTAVVSDKAFVTGDLKGRGGKGSTKTIAVA